MLRVRSLPALLSLIALLVGVGARADAPPLYRLSGAKVQVGDGAVELSYQGRTLIYVQGLGWLGNVDAAPPEVVGDSVLVGPSLLDALGLVLPRLQDVRFGGDAEVRVVLDLPGLSPADLRSAEGEGEVARDTALNLALPPMLLPVDSPDPYRGVEVRLEPGTDHTALSVRGPAFHYRAFALADPTRLVLDVVPQRAPALPDLDEALAPGIRYRRFYAPAASGSSLVHLVSVAPGAGEFRVVGESHVPRTLSELASGALVAINAGYFDTRTFDAIGYLRVDYGLLSLPTRTRAAIAFGGDGTTIARLSADVTLRVDGLPIAVGDSSDGVSVATAAGASVGTPHVGVLTVQQGVVLANRIGPATVPPDGFALVYPPDRRALARVDARQRASLQLDLHPSTFDGAPYGVEAGPLLLRGGRPAFDPGAEGFADGQRILDAVTQQSAVGVRPDGTVLLVVAEAMRAADLVPLFVSLGARDAMRLDSGSSATLLADGKVLNRGGERQVVSAIVVRVHDAP